MASYNKVILMGNLTCDPMVRTLPDSLTHVSDFGLAVNLRWKDRSGGDRQEVLFIDCAAFGSVGDMIGANLTKGRPMHVEGYLTLSQWEQGGQRRSKIRLVVERFQYLDKKPTVERPKTMPGKRDRDSMGPRSSVDRRLTVKSIATA